MVRLDNKKTIRALTHRFIRKYKKNTIAMIFALSLIISLSVSLLTLVHTNHWLEAEQYLFIYTNIDYQINGLDSNEIDWLKSDDNIEQLGIKQSIGNAQTDFQTAHIIAANNASILATSTLLSGRMPEKSGEIVAEKWALLNMGINPVLNTDFSLSTGDSEKTTTFTIVGIINDISFNKLAGSINLYTIPGNHTDQPYTAEIKFRDKINKTAALESIKRKLDISEKNISGNPWLENTRELMIIDIEIISILLVICFAILWGIYRISLLARENQYGILRAIGVTSRQVKRMILSELINFYVASIPLGTLLGLLFSHIITLISKNDEMEIYFWGERAAFRLMIPIIPILICIASVGVILCIVAIFGSHKINQQSITDAILGSKNNDSKKHDGIPLRNGKDKFLLAKLGCKYVFCEFRTTLAIILSLSIGGCLFYGLAYKATLSFARTTIAIEGNFYNSDYMLTSNDDMSAVNGIKSKTLKKAEKIPEITRVEAQMAMPVKVLDDDTPRVDDYFSDKEERVKKIYGFSLSNQQNDLPVYHTKLKGYNTTALKQLSSYVVEGSYNPENMKSNEVIIAMPRMVQSGKAKGSVGFFKNGIPVMDYKVGQTVTVYYRSDLDTSSDDYWHCTDRKNLYNSQNYKIAAIAYYPYMKEVSVIEQSYPLLITSEENYKQVNQSGVYETVNLNINDKTTEKRQEEIEYELIELSVLDGQVTTRSLISEKAKINMMYYKELTYIYGIAVVSFILILINLVNSLKYRIQTRKSELCIYRAVGMGAKHQAKLIRFENTLFGVFSLMIVFTGSHILSRLLYEDSQIYLYGISYQYNVFIFTLLSMFTLAICWIISDLLNRELTKENILSELDKIE